MKYGHVGRPTNEEVAARKRKKALTVIIPLVLIIVAVLVINNNGLDGLMGNSTCEYTCEDDWTLDGSICYQEHTATAEINAYLVGDVVNEYGETDPDGQVTLQDWTHIKNAIDNQEELSDEQKLVYDLNGDGQVNENDIADYSTSTSGGFVNHPKYVCPKEKTEEHTNGGSANSYEMKTITTTKYELNGSICNEETTTKVQKRAVCKQDTVQQPAVAQDETPEVPQEEQQTVDNTPSSANACTYNQATNQYMCYDAAVQQPVSTNETGITDDSDEYDTDEYNELDDDIEYDEEGLSGDAVINKTSNYLKYADTNNAEYSFQFLTIDSETGLFAPIDGSVTVNKTAGCKDEIKLTSIGIKHSGQDVISVGIFKDGNKTHPVQMNYEHKNFIPNLNNFDYVRESLASKGSVDLYLDMSLNDSNYSVKQNCQKVTVTKGQTKVPQVIFNVKAKKYVNKVTVDFGKLKDYVTNNGVISYDVEKKSYKKFPTGSSFKIEVGKPKNATSKLLTGIKHKNGKTYKLAGFNLMKDDNYLCYSDASHNNKKFTWAKKCSHGRIMFLSNKTSDLVDYLRDGGSYTIKTQGKTGQIVVKLKNSKTNKAYQRWAKLQLYKSKNGCEKVINTEKYGSEYTQPSLQKTNKGVIKINNNLELGKTYYLGVNISTFYNKQTSPQCIAVKATTKNVDVKLVPKHFEVKYAKGNDSAKGSLADQKGGKYTDKVITLKKNNGSFTRKGYEFSHWVASRKVTENGKKVTQYKCVKSGKTYQWTDISVCKSKGYKEYKGGAKMNINTYEGDITMHARWKKKGTTTTTKKTTTKKTTTKKTTTKKTTAAKTTTKTPSTNPTPAKTPQKSVSKKVKKVCSNVKVYYCNKGYEKNGDGPNASCRKIEYYCSSPDVLVSSSIHKCKHTYTERKSKSGKCKGPIYGRKDVGKTYVPGVGYTCSLNNKTYSVSIDGNGGKKQAGSVAYQNCASNCVHNETKKKTKNIDAKKRYVYHKINVKTEKKCN